MALKRNFSNNSATYTASAAVVTEQGYFDGMAIQTDGSNNVTLNVFDLAASSTGGREMVPTNTIIEANTGISALAFDPPLSFSKGIYVEATAGAGTFAYQVIWRKD